MNCEGSDKTDPAHSLDTYKYHYVSPWKGRETYRFSPCVRLSVRTHEWTLVKKQLFVAFPWVVTSTGPGGGGVMVVCVFYDENSRRLNRKWFYGEVGNRTCDP